MSVQTRQEIDPKDRAFMQSLAILYCVVNVFLIIWLLQASTAAERIASGFSLFVVSFLLLQSVDRLRSDSSMPIRVDETERQLRAKRTVLLVLGFASWLGLYAVGCRVGAWRYIQALERPDIGLAETVWSALVIGMSYTYSNVGILCIIAALIGGLGRRLSQCSGHGRLRNEVVEGLLSKAVLRSVVIAVVVICSALALGSPVTFRTVDPYVSFAMMMSAVGLVNGYMPQWFYHEN
jgi:hypothetical protein